MLLEKVDTSNWPGINELNDANPSLITVNYYYYKSSFTILHFTAILLAEEISTYFYGDTKKTICVLPTVYYSAFHSLDVCRKYPIIPPRIIRDADISAYGQRPRGKKNANRALRHACQVSHLRPLMAYWWVFNNPFRF